MVSYGVSNKYDYYEFAIDSRDFSGSGSGGVSGLNWPMFFVGGKTPLTNIVGLKILAAEIPFTYYVFNSGNNTFQVGQDGVTWADVSIPPGNYTAENITAVLKDIIETAIPALTVTVTYSDITLKLNIASNGSLFLQFGDITNAGNTSVRHYLGFNYGVFGNVGPVNSQAPNAVLMSGPNYLYINSTRFGALTNNYLPQGPNSIAGNTGPQMARVPVNADSGSIIFYRDPGTFFLIVDPEKYFFLGDSNSMQQIDFYLTAGTGTEPVDLNGVPFSLKLALLVQKMNHDETLSGMRSEGREVKRARPY